MTQDPLFAINRRAFLGHGAGTLGSLALAHLLAAEADRPAAAASPGRGPRPAHHPPTADAVICLFQHGGPSHMDLFDPKPELVKADGKPYAGDLEVHFDNQKGNCLASPFQFRPHGQSGTEISELLPHTAGIVDDITLLRSLTTESVDHESALRLIHGGKFQAGYPTWGSWAIYGLGSRNRDLPAYLVLTDPSGLPVDGVRNWSAGYLPASYQGTAIRAGGAALPNLNVPAGIPEAARRGQLDLLARLNVDHLRRYPGNTELEARITDFEIAARMQTAIPAVLDVSDEPESIRRLYGLDNPATAEYGRRCLIARRLVERGVRFVQLFLAGQPWDTHSNNAATLKGLCARIDGPSAALVTDLKQRGMLDRTVVFWGGEFGRLPISQGKDGRDHNRHANSVWLAGGGFRRGYVHGATDDLGYAAARDVVTVHQLQATLLHALGLNHKELTYPHEGRPGSLTDAVVTKAEVVRQLLG